MSTLADNGKYVPVVESRIGYVFQHLSIVQRHWRFRWSSSAKIIGIRRDDTAKEAEWWIWYVFVNDMKKWFKSRFCTLLITSIVSVKY